MVRHRYPNPPVVEALCEVFLRGSAWDPTVPGLFYERVRANYPKRGQQDIPDEPQARFVRDDGSRMIQLARNLLVVNQLQPYPRFEDWRPEVLSALDVYREVATPTGIDRIGLRYINRVSIPAKAADMKEYFRLYPEIPDEFGAGQGAFMVRVEVEAKPANHSLVVTLGSAPPNPEGGSAFMLDLYETVVPRNGADFDSAASLIDEAHANIERVFENLITDAARALFGG